ncbi:MAG: UDP-N-acetylglucosamine 2-epimerase (hydrolyzing) [Muribaculaceae bacterium]|nr:UDP-N-acetylglucosamine 2-epimerase (hydrolyzing) [Muribaculaceae bacterium]
MKRPLKIALVTTTRADWGILAPLARALECHDDVRLTVLVGNMHLLPKFGMTVNEIEKENFNDVRRLETNVPSDDDTAYANALLTGAMTEAAARAFREAEPDMVLLLGDRFETLGIATAAAIMTIPIVHLHGGEISAGANDDSFRHAISKLATLHFTATERSRDRLLAMGEQPDRVFHVGALGVTNALTIPVMTLDEINSSLDGFVIEPDRTILVTYHPVTLDPDGRDPIRQLNELLDAFDRFPELKILFTYPNNDAGGRRIIDRIEEYGAANPGRVKVVPSLGQRRFLSTLRYVKAMVGNSSSGILEVPSAGAVTIDIGTRQLGRERAASVVNVPVEADSIARVIGEVLSGKILPLSDPEDNPYYRPDTLERMVEIFTTADPSALHIKLFNEQLREQSENQTL